MIDIKELDMHESVEDLIHDWGESNLVEEDQGIGWYEYWGTEYRDVNIQPALPIHECILNVKEDDEPIYFDSSYTGSIDFFDYKAQLINVTVDKTMVYKFEYEVYEQ